MTENEADVIEHLIEIEKNASSITDTALKEADLKIKQAKKLAEENYSKKYNDGILKIEEEFENQKKQIQEDTDQKINKYKEKFQATSQNKEAFVQLLENIFAS